MTHHRLKVAGTALALTFLAACDSNHQPPPAPTTTSSTTSTARTNPAAQAPPVQQPLNAGGFVTDPCKSLTEAQQKQFALDNARVSDVAVEGTSCFYRQNHDTKHSVSVTYAEKMTTGLSSRYAEHAAGTWDYWAPATVDGYPAVGYATTRGGCNFAIGIKESLYFWVTADDTPGATKCAAAKDVASAVLTTIKAGG